MVTAIILLTVQRDQIRAVADTLADMDGITEVYSVAGRYDLSVIARAKATEKLERLVTDQILNVNGITKSETLIAFRVCSRYDLERMFEID